MAYTKLEKDEKLFELQKQVESIDPGTLTSFGNNVKDNLTVFGNRISAIMDGSSDDGWDDKVKTQIKTSMQTIADAAKEKEKAADHVIGGEGIISTMKYAVNEYKDTYEQYEARFDNKPQETEPATESDGTETRKKTEAFKQWEKDIFIFEKALPELQEQANTWVDQVKAYFSAYDFVKNEVDSNIYKPITDPLVFFGDLKTKYEGEYEEKPLEENEVAEKKPEEEIEETEETVAAARKKEIEKKTNAAVGELVAEGLDPDSEEFAEKLKEKLKDAGLTETEIAAAVDGYKKKRNGEETSTEEEPTTEEESKNEESDESEDGLEEEEDIDIEDIVEGDHSYQIENEDPSKTVNVTEHEDGTTTIEINGEEFEIDYDPTDEANKDRLRSDLEAHGGDNYTDEEMDHLVDEISYKPTPDEEDDTSSGDGDYPEETDNGGIDESPIEDDDTEELDVEDDDTDAVEAAPDTQDDEEELDLEEDDTSSSPVVRPEKNYEVSSGVTVHEDSDGTTTITMDDPDSTDTTTFTIDYDATDPANREQLEADLRAHGASYYGPDEIDHMADEIAYKPEPDPVDADDESWEVTYDDPSGIDYQIDNGNETYTLTYDENPDTTNKAVIVSNEDGTGSYSGSRGNYEVTYKTDGPDGAGYYETNLNSGQSEYLGDRDSAYMVTYRIQARDPETGELDEPIYYTGQKMATSTDEAISEIVKNITYRYGEDIANQNADYVGTYDVVDDTLVCSNDYFVVTEESGYCLDDPDTEVDPLDIGNG